MAKMERFSRQDYLKTALNEPQYKFSTIIYQFRDTAVNARYKDYMRCKAVHKGAMWGLTAYNIATGPSFIYYNLFVNRAALHGHHGIYGRLFTVSVFLVQALFSLLFVIETVDKARLSDGYREFLHSTRSYLLPVYVCLSTLCCGFAMNLRSSNPCTPDQTGVMDVFYCTTSPPGMIPVDTFVIGILMAVFHHFVLPVQWSAVVVAWLCELVLAILSILPTASPQMLVSNIVMIVFHVSTIALHATLQYNVLVDFVRECADDVMGEGTSSGTTSGRQLSQNEETEVIGKFLASMYRRQEKSKSGANSGATEDDASSVSMSEYTMPSHALSSISAISNMRNRGGNHAPAAAAAAAAGGDRSQEQRKFLTKEKGLSVSTREG